MTENFTDEDIERAEGYEASLRWIEDHEPAWDEADVQRAEGYEATLKFIEENGELAPSDEELEQLREYVALLKEKEELGG